jgi:WD40 repeat protein
MSTYSEVWGCATHPQNDNIYVSAGGDKFIRMWQYDKEGAPKQILESVELGDDVTALDWSACGKWIACGDREAKLTIIDSETLGRKVSNAISSKMSAAQAAKMRGRNNFKS